MSLRLCHRNQLSPSPKIVCSHIEFKSVKCLFSLRLWGDHGEMPTRHELILISFISFFDSYQVRMASELCDVDDSVKETSSSYPSSSSTTDSQMPLIEDQRSESATISTQIHDLTDEHDRGNYHFLTFTRKMWLVF